MGILDLGPFRRELEKQQRAFARALVEGHLPQSVAAARVTVELMEADLAKGESALKTSAKPNPQVPGPPAFRWRRDAQHMALRKTMPSARDPQRYEKVVKEFDQYAAQLRANVQKSF